MAYRTSCYHPTYYLARCRNTQTSTQTIQPPSRNLLAQTSGATQPSDELFEMLVASSVGLRTSTLSPHTLQTPSTTTLQPPPSNRGWNTPDVSFIEHRRLTYETLAQQGNLWTTLAILALAPRGVARFLARVGRIPLGPNLGLIKQFARL